MFDIVLFGKPGVGKGTQADLLKDFFKEKISHLSTGDVFRALCGKPNAIGDYVTDRLNAGFLIDDKVTISLFNSYFYTVLDQNKSMLLDGYPRTMTQMESFLTLAKENNRKVIGLNFDLSDDLAIERLISRGREGETRNIIQTRLQEYYKHTDPLCARFKKDYPFHNIDANSSIESIHKSVVSLLDAV